MINLEISEDKVKEFEASAGTEAFVEIKEKFGEGIAAIAVALHTSKATELMKLKDALTMIGWKEAAVAVGGVTGGAEEVSAEPTEFDLVITSVLPGKMMGAIKAIRQLSHQTARDLSLSDAKALVEGVSDNKIVFAKYESKDKAEEDAKKFEGIAEAKVQGS